jgi:hypothetical protein
LWSRNPLIETTEKLIPTMLPTQLRPQPTTINAEAQSPLQTVLADIAHHVDLSTPFCIQHPQYKDYALPPEVIQRLQQGESSLAERYAVLHLRSYFYGIYYNSSLRSIMVKSDADSKAHEIQTLENNSTLGVDLELYDQLHQANQGQGYWDSGWEVKWQEPDGTYAVSKRELRLHIDPQHYLPDAERTLSKGDSVTIRLPKNLVQNGFYMAVGDQGSDSLKSSADFQPCLVRLYFNVPSDGAIALMEQITGAFNAQQIPFSFKALYNREDYGREDAAVLYFDRSYYERVHPLMQQIYQGTQAYFQAPTPLFTKILAPGLGLAEEPDFRFGHQESFGMNRCHILAKGLLAAQAEGLTTPTDKLNRMLQMFEELQLNWQQPYLNQSSKDDYTVIN